MNKSRTIMALTAFALLSIILPFLTDASFEHLIAILAAQLFIALPLLIAAAVISLLNKKRQRNDNRLPKILATIATGIILQLISIPIITQTEKKRVDAAEKYCKALIPVIEDYRALHHKYPEDLHAIHATAKLPSLLKGQKFYRATAAGYEFSFHTPLTFLETYRYDYQTKKWVLID